jgi:hypothetical protein
MNVNEYFDECVKFAFITSEYICSYGNDTLVKTYYRLWDPFMNKGIQTRGKSKVSITSAEEENWT